MQKMMGSCLVAALLVGCGSNQEEGTYDRYAKNRTIMNSQGIDDTIMFLSQEVFDEIEGVLVQAKRTFEFGFDRSQISEEDTRDLAEHAAYLIKHPDLRVRVEGHTDARGSREYNIGLGERRARALEQALLALGVQPEQVVVVSYGKERLVDPNQTDEAHQRNRRAVLVYEAL